MIFLTVGNQLPFDRLVQAVDAWLAQGHRVEAVAQIGASRLSPRHMRCVTAVDAESYGALMQEASHVIAHAGMGTVISARMLGKPLLVMPRQSSQGEVRSDHQFATCRYLETLESVWVAWDTEDLQRQLPSFLESAPTAFGDPTLSGELVSMRSFVQEFVLSDRGGRS